MAVDGLEHSGEVTYMSTIQQNPNHSGGNSLLEGYITPPELAAQLGISLRTLCRWHVQRIGPKRITNGRLILYREAAVREWLETRETQGAPRPEPRFREGRS